MGLSFRFPVTSFQALNFQTANYLAGILNVGPGNRYPVTGTLKLK
ncbi:hypothetical protein GGD38_003300 [Chitinophagaceae bacterium OAS944]|nr:hypothetical protein [Chitinophagaceae bacterium OAS944]